jgi:CheY-like chemotaxis protein
MDSGAEDASGPAAPQGLRGGLPSARACTVPPAALATRLAGVLHELNTPLNAVIGFSHLLGTHSAVAQHPDLAERVAHIAQAGDHMRRLVTDLLDLATMEAGQLRVACVPVDLAALLGSAVCWQSKAAEARGVMVDTVGAGRPVWVQADPTRLRQIILNLLSNGVKYNRPQGRLTLRVRPAGQAQVVLEVTDTGHGLSEAQLAELFQPFNRLWAASTSIAGAGLGLALSHRLAAQMGGGLTAASTVGQGTTFSLALGAAAAPPPAALAAPPERRCRADDGLDLRPAVVLYVEDNALNLAVMQRALAQLPAVRLETVADGQLALFLARSLQPDLILLDLNLPGLSGREVCHQLRLDPATAAIPCVAVSGEGLAAEAAQGAEPAFDAYIAKPFAVPEVVQVVRQLLALRGRGMTSASA